MKKIIENYIFTGFGFEVLLKNVEIKQAHGSEYPEINLTEVKILTAKQLMKSREKLTGHKLKFLRTLLKISYQGLSEIVDVPASTLKSWEDRGEDATGLTAPQERLFRMHVIESLLNAEKQMLEREVIKAESFEKPLRSSPLNLS